MTAWIWLYDETAGSPFAAEAPVGGDQLDLFGSVL